MSLHQGTPIVTNVWWNMWEAGIGHRANELANSGYKVCICLTVVGLSWLEC